MTESTTKRQEPTYTNNYQPYEPDSFNQMNSKLNEYFGRQAKVNQFLIDMLEHIHARTKHAASELTPSPTSHNDPALADDYNYHYNSYFY